MKLRNGKTYTYKPIIRLSNNSKNKLRHTSLCAICCDKYKKGDHIVSCLKQNITKHSFHINCFKLALKYNKIQQFKLVCPYCTIDIDYNKLEYKKMRY